MIPKSVMSFDELNALVVNKKAIPYEEYFGEMGITDEQKKRRIKLAEDFDELFLVILAEEFYAQQNGQLLAEEYIRDTVEKGYLEITKGLEIDTRERAKQFASDFARVTVKHSQTPYYLSMDRAEYNAENESNLLFNGVDYQNALKDKKYKVWNSVGDEVTREDHLVANGEAIPIDDPFKVGNSLMLYPKDTSLGADPEQIVNCRCWLTFK